MDDVTEVVSGMRSGPTELISIQGWASETADMFPTAIRVSRANRVNRVNRISRVKVNGAIWVGHNVVQVGVETTQPLGVDELHDTHAGASTVAMLCSRTVSIKSTQMHRLTSSLVCKEIFVQSTFVL